MLRVFLAMSTSKRIDVYNVFYFNIISKHTEYLFRIGNTVRTYKPAYLRFKIG